MGGGLFCSAGVNVSVDGDPELGASIGLQWLHPLKFPVTGVLN